jgi:hypothetical protein
MTIPAHYEGSIIPASLAEVNTPAFLKRLEPLIWERFKLGAAPAMRIDSQVALKRGLVRVLDRGRAFFVEYLAVICGDQAIVLHAGEVGSPSRQALIDLGENM